MPNVDVVSLEAVESPPAGVLRVKDLGVSSHWNGDYPSNVFAKLENDENSMGIFTDYIYMIIGIYNLQSDD